MIDLAENRCNLQKLTKQCLRLSLQQSQYFQFLCWPMILTDSPDSHPTRARDPAASNPLHPTLLHPTLHPTQARCSSKSQPRAAATAMACTSPSNTTLAERSPATELKIPPRHHPPRLTALARQTPTPATVKSRPPPATTPHQPTDTALTLTVRSSRNHLLLTNVSKRLSFPACQQ